MSDDNPELVITEIFRANLRKLRGTKTQQQMADRLGMNRSHYADIENGTSSNVTIEKLSEIASLANLPPALLIMDSPLLRSL